MGCPQSKSKSRDFSNNGETGSQSAGGRNDAVQPEGRLFDKATEEKIRKKLTKGQPDVYIPDDIAEQRPSRNGSMKSRSSKVSGKNARANSFSDQDSGRGETVGEISSGMSDVGSEKQESAKASPNSVSVANASAGSKLERNASQKSDRGKKKDIMLNSVFIPDESPDVLPEVAGNVKDTFNNPVDVGDVDIGQAVNEIGMDDQTISLNDNVGRRGSASNTSLTGKVSRTGSVRSGTQPTYTSNGDYTGEEIHTEDGYTYREQPFEKGKTPSVKYQNKDKVEYELPEGVPRPAPPKTRKSDIIQPTTFTIADKLVDEAPAESFSSMTKLAGYLSGAVKKSELESGNHDDESPTEGQNLPPPKPVTRKKKEIVPDPTVFRKVDENARNTPETVRLSVEKLAAHLCRGTQSDLEKVRAFYYWICNNISYIYDRDKTLVEKLRFDAVSTLRQGQGSFVNLMAAFCKEASIPVVTILGCSKSMRREPDKQFIFGERNHSWNAVYIDGEWRFVDCTWGSGYLDAERKFHRQFDEFWFLTDPEIFVYDHFPAHSIWQLLEEPIDIDDFNKKPSLTERSRELGFQLISHREPIINFQNEVNIQFGTETYPLSNITADLRNEEGMGANEHRCMRRIDAKTFEVRVIPPKPGEYTLLLYGKVKDYRHAKFRKLMEYTLRCDAVLDEPVVFPDHLKAWGPEPNYQELGFADSILTLSVFTNDTNEMTIPFEMTKTVNVTADIKLVADKDTDHKEYILLTAKENTKNVHVRFPKKGYYRLDLFAEGELEKYEYAGSFLIYCSVTDEPKPFPKFNSESISKHCCALIEPMYRELPADTLVKFSIRSRVLKNAMIGVPVEEEYGSRMKGLGELKKSGEFFSIEIKTPAAGETLLLSGSSAPPNVFWSRLYEYVTV